MRSFDALDDAAAAAAADVDVVLAAVPPEANVLLPLEDVTTTALRVLGIDFR